MREDDSLPLMAVFGDPIVMAAFGRGPFSNEEMGAWVARNLEHQRQHGYGLFIVELSDTGLVIGDCGLERQEIDGRLETELGYDLRSDHWGRGLATEAASAVVHFAFTTLGLPSLVSLVRANNTRSAHVAQRIGMERRRTLKRSGVTYDLYGMDAEPSGARLAGEEGFEPSIS